jgi:hypothetical protein
MGYIGSSGNDSWPANVVYDASESNFSRIQLCAGLRDILLEKEDPRLPLWFNKVVTRIKVSTEYPDDDQIVDGVRYIRPEWLAANDYVIYNKNTWVDDVNAGKFIVDTMEYVGIPAAVSAGEPYPYNLNPAPTQGGYNVHVSALADMYRDAEGELLKARLITYSEVCFILAEAAQKGWSVGSQQAWYENGVRASFDYWGLSSDADTYLSNQGVVYDGSLAQIMEQKWVSNWTVASESWCDWRRTGLPALTVGPSGRRDAFPLRFRYDANERERNKDNYNTAITNLVQTEFTAQDGNDSSWSKFWLLQ